MPHGSRTLELRTGIGRATGNRRRDGGAHRCAGAALAALAGVLLLAAATPGGAAAARPPVRISAAADTVESVMAILTDTPAEFRAAGTVSYIDEDAPPNGFNTGFTTQVDVAGTNWTASFGALVLDWCIGPPCAKLNGARGISITMNGEHVIGPHSAGSPTDVDPNLIPGDSKFQSSISWAVVPVSMTIQGKEEHPTSDASKPHTDLFGFQFWASALEGPPNMLSGPMEVALKHVGERNTKEKLTFGGTECSTDAAGANASYDAGTGTLTIHSGAIDVLNDIGFLGGGIAPTFVSDPIRDAQLGDVVLQYLGPTGDGGYRFGGAHLALSDPEGELSLEGDFGEYRIYDTSRSGVIDSYALLDRTLTSDAGSCRSAFLGEFNDLDMLGQSLSSAERLDVQGVGFTFRTTTDLALLTSGFTASAFAVPASVGICALKVVH